MKKIWHFKNPISAVSWLLIDITILAGMIIVFSPSLLEFVILILIDLSVTAIAVVLLEPRIFPKIFPDSTAYFNGFDGAALKSYSMQEKVNILNSLLKFPKRRAFYALVINFVYKLPPTFFVVFYIWEYQEDPFIRFFKLFILMLLSYSFFSAATFIESHNQITGFIHEVHKKYNLGKVFVKLSNIKYSKSEFMVYESVALLTIFGSMLLLTALIIYGAEFDVGSVIFSVIFIMLIAFLAIGRIWYLNRRYFYGGLFTIFQSIEAFNPRRLNIELPIYSTSLLSRFSLIFNQLVRRLEENEIELSSYLANQIEKNRYQSLGEVSAIVSHDLASPLNAIRFCTESIIEEPENASNPRYQKHLKDSLENALDLIESLRAYLRDPESRDSSCTTFIEAHEYVCKFLKYRFPQVDFDDSFILSEEAYDNNLSIKISRTNLIHVLQNLYSNSIKNALMNKYQPRIKVTVRKISDDDKVEIIIHDNGTGLSDREFEKLTGSESQEGSLSLGLRLTRRLIEKSGGIIRNESSSLKDLKGTKYTILFSILGK